MPTPLAAARTARGWTQHQLLRALRARARAGGHELPPDSTLRVTLSGWEERPALSRPSLPAAAGRSPGDDRDRPGFWIGWQTGPDSSPPGGPRATGLLGDCSCLPHSSRWHHRVLLSD